VATEHRLERRARLLADRMRTTSEDMAVQLGAGDRAPFTTALTKSESLAWWRLHRHDAYGAQALARMQPLDVARLDLDLARAMNPEEVAVGQ
jgi:hypothetical protein